MKIIKVVFLCFCLVACCSCNDGLAEVKGRKVPYKIQYDVSAWSVKEDSIVKDAEYEFSGKAGFVQAVLIAENLATSVQSLKEASLINARAASDNNQVEIISEKTIEKENKTFIELNFRLTVSGTAVSYLGRYYSGPQGSVQFIAYYSEQEMPDLDKVRELLEGLEI